MKSLGETLKRVAREAAWAPAAVLVLHAAGGHLFRHEPLVDPMAHLLGGAAVAFFVRRACSIARERLGALSPFSLDLLAFGLACAAALLWEFGELLSDIYLGTQAQASLAETLRDLVLGVVGAVAYLSLARMARRPGRENSLPLREGW